MRVDLCLEMAPPPHGMVKDHNLAEVGDVIFIVKHVTDNIIDKISVVLM